MAIEQAFNFRRVNDQLATAGIPTAEQLGGLADIGVEQVINLLPDSSEYAVPGERDIVEEQGLAYCHIPVDFAAPTRADFEAFREAMDEAEGKCLFVHCAANYRVSAFYSRYAVEGGKWSPEEAAGFIASIWNPEEYPPWSAFLKECGIQ